MCAATRAQELYGRPWIEREYVVALDSYFTNRAAPRHSQAAFIKDLSRLLGRTPASVVMRMENFASLDPEENFQRRGLVNVSPLCRRVFQQWKDKRAGLHDCADVYLREITGPQADNLSLFESTLLLPRAFGRYDLLDQLGEGGFGVVFSCIDPESERRFALKIIKTDRIHDTEGMHRFRREIRILRTIDHPHLIKMHEDNLETEATYPGFVMDLATTTLAEYLQERSGQTQRPALSAAEAMSILDSVISAVVMLHSHSPKVIHRDINPSNILQMPGGRWVVADFSLAKFVDGGPAASYSTVTRAMCGTTYYAAPEQFRDLKLTDERTDVHGLGMLMWELFSKEWPFPQLASSGLPPPLDEIFRRAVARMADERYQTVLDFKAELQNAMKAM
jgi:hypothetical protein